MALARERSEFDTTAVFGGGGRVPLDNVDEDTLLDEAKRFVRVERERWTSKKEFGWYDWLAAFIPFFGWMRTYKWREWLLPDVAAGLSVAAMVVPQGMSYAQNLAFLPQVYGLYGAFTPCIFYALLGSSRQLAVGPVAVTSLLLGSGLSDIYGKFAVNPSDPENALIAYKQQQYNVGAIQVAFVAGCFYTAVGLFRLGFIVRILSHPMISGFMSGAVLIIASGQVKYLCIQMSLPRADTLQGNLYYVFSPTPDPKKWPPGPYPFHWREFLICISLLVGLFLIYHYVPKFNERVVKKKYGRIPSFFKVLDLLLATVWSLFIIFLICYVTVYVNDNTPWKWRETAMGGSFLVILFLIKNTARSIKKLRFLQFLGPLIVCVISIAIMNAAKLYIINPDDSRTPLVKPVGLIPKGMPPVTVSWWLPLYHVGQIVQLSLLICMIDICESVSIAKSLAQKNHYKLDGTQELRGLGIANIAGACFNAYTTTGSFSRSAVNNSVGAQTPLAQIICGLTVMLVLLVATPIFQNMSANVQGAIIIFGVISLFDISEGIHLWKVSKFDWLVWTTGLLITSFAGVEFGILASVGVSILLLLIKQFFPVLKKLGVIPGTREYRDAKLHPEAEVVGSVVLVKVEGSISFLNGESVKEYLRDSLEGARERAAKKDPSLAESVRFIVLDLSAVADVDATALHLFSEFTTELEKYYKANLLLASPNVEVIRALKRAGLVNKIGKENIHDTVADAVAAAEAAAATDALSSKPSTRDASSDDEQQAVQQQA